MPYQTDLAVALRDWGLPVVEVNGWKTRGSSSFSPKGAVNHHTAGSRNGILPSYNILVNGRSDLPGPLCNVAQTRSSAFDTKAKFDEVYVIAAGRANHAGSGGWKGLVGNSSVFGLEIEHTGNLSTEIWPERRQHTAYRVHCAFMQLGGFSAETVAQHFEWTPRKIDFVGANGTQFRNAVILTALSRNNPVPPKESGEMVEDIYWLHRVYLKASEDTSTWTRAMLQSFNYHLWRALTGTAMETIRQDFQKTAGL